MTNYQKSYSPVFQLDQNRGVLRPAPKLLCLSALIEINLKENSNIKISVHGWRHFLMCNTHHPELLAPFHKWKNIFTWGKTRGVPMYWFCNFDMYNTYARTHWMREHRCQDSTHFWITGKETGVPVYIKTMQSCKTK
jgi:hypothetical protein